MSVTAEQMDAMPEGAKVRDKHGDIWTKGAVVWHTPETAPFVAEVIVRKWGPLSLVCPDGGKCHHACEVNSCFRVQFAGPLSGVFPNDTWPDEVKVANPLLGDVFEVMSDESDKPVLTYVDTPLEEIPDVELPGMWEHADFTGSPDVIRGPALSTERAEEKRERFMETYGMGREGVARFFAVSSPDLQQKQRENPFAFPMLRREEEIVFEEGRGSYPTGRYRLVSDWMDSKTGI